MFLADPKLHQVTLQFESGTAFSRRVTRVTSGYGINDRWPGPVLPRCCAKYIIFCIFISSHPNLILVL